MATAAIDTELPLDLSFDGLLNANSSTYPTNWPAFWDFLDQLFDVKNTGVQETTNLDGENIFDSEDFNLDVYSDENYEFDVCGIPDPPWDPHIDPAVPRNDLQNRPATLPLPSMEESLSNPANSVTPFQQFLNIALPEDTLQRALREDSDDSSVYIPYRPKQLRFPPESVAVLKIWLEKHMEYPYPTSQEKIELAAKAHLSVQQVSNWFVNHRQRQLPPKQQMSPMEAWLSSSSDDEAASDDDIRRALQNQRKKDTPMYNIKPRTNFSSFQIPGPPSDARSVSTGSISSISSIGSAFSQCQDAVLSGPPRRGRKRHYGLPSIPLKLSGQNDRNSTKKRKAASDVGSDTDGPSSDPNFQCTFCYKRLSSKTWKRHETTQHFPQHQWTCMKNGFRTAYDPLTCQKSVEGLLSPPKSMCVFCNSSDPDESHAVFCHRILQCLENPESDRTFSRKDHLVQHLRRFHNSSLSSFFLESWKSKTELDDFEWNCGFCGDSLRSWNIRANHIAKHFRERKTMADWCSNRGVYGPFECLCCPKGPRKFQNIVDLQMHEMRRSVPFDMDGSYPETSHGSGEPQTKAEQQKGAHDRLVSFIVANIPGSLKGEELDKAVWRPLSRVTGWEGNDSGSAGPSGEANGISSSQQSAPASNITRDASNDTEGIQDTITLTEVFRGLSDHFGLEWSGSEFKSTPSS